MSLDFLKKSDALEFLGKIRKRRDVDGGCAGGRCTFEEDNDVFDDTSFGELVTAPSLLWEISDSVPPSDGVSTGAHHDAAGTLLFGSLDCFDPETLSGAQFREVFDEEGELKAAVVYRLIKPRQRRAKTNHL
ncbi:unnamed protein product [Lepidochelys kempii]